MAAFPELGAWEPTREALHRTVQVLSAVPRKFAPHHERWQHISFKAGGGGLWLDPFALPGGGNLHLGIRTEDHAVVLDPGSGPVRTWSLAASGGPARLAEELYEAAAELGLAGLSADRFAADETHRYDPEAAARYFSLIFEIERVFKIHRARLAGETGPVRLWPHNFDIGFDWLGGRPVENETDGEIKTSPAQINLGWAPGDESHPEPYFYSNPWPFDPALKKHPLPHGAFWMDGPWKGSLLPYRKLAGDPAAEDRLLEYAGEVFRLAIPTLV